MSKQKANKKQARTPVLSMGSRSARKFLLRDSSYCRFDLPAYLEFGGMLRRVSKYLRKHPPQFASNPARQHTGVNHTILDNKDGRYAWRPMELIHPALYVQLVHLMTKRGNWKQLKRRFDTLTKEKRIKCMSIPVKGIKRDGRRIRRDRAAMARQWWEQIEQRSIRLALDYEYICHTDISDCYGSIYTHSVAWAMHGKRKAKRHRNRKSMIGNAIDKCLQDMNEGQTNGVPQGSVLVDLIVELVLCYADKKIAKKAKEAKVRNYQILRYRDDYRIFVKNPLEGEQLLKIASEVMYSLGLKLNPAKTESSSDVMTSVIKDDKLHWNRSVQRRRGLQQHLMLIRELSKTHPHSGSLVKALTKFLGRLNKRKKINDAHELISIVVDIALRNPRTYSICVAIISKLLPKLGKKRRKRVLHAVRCRFNEIPNTGHLQLWLQRVTYPSDPQAAYEEPVCKLVAGQKTEIWNADWITSTQLKKLLDPSTIVNTAKLKKLRPTVAADEVSLFEPVS